MLACELQTLGLADERLPDVLDLHILVEAAKIVEPNKDKETFGETY
jgi:hypothetical protein